jgi:hypothetical protein
MSRPARTGTCDPHCGRGTMRAGQSSRRGHGYDAADPLERGDTMMPQTPGAARARAASPAWSGRSASTAARRWWYTRSRRGRRHYPAVLAGVRAADFDLLRTFPVDEAGGLDARRQP